MKNLINKVHNKSYTELLPLLDDQSVHVTITDPPFGINYQNNYTSREKHQVMQGDEKNFSYQELGNQCYQVQKDNSAIFCFTGWSEYPRHFCELENSGFKMKEPVICQKRPSGTSDLYGTFQSNSDWCMFGHKGRFIFKQTSIMKNKRAGTVPNKGRQPVPEFKTRFPSCWFGSKFPWSSENSSFQKQNEIYHPTIKSVEFIKWLILLTTDEGDTVLDPFLGSGTTAVAALELGRNFIGCELNADYCELANKRIFK